MEACRLPTDGLIEFELRGRFAPLRLTDVGLIPIEELYDSPGSGRRYWRGFGGFADMEQDALDWFRFGDERDQPHLAAACRAEQWQDLINAGDQCGPQIAGGAVLSGFDDFLWCYGFFLRRHESV